MNDIDIGIGITGVIFMGLGLTSVTANPDIAFAFGMGLSTKSLIEWFRGMHR